MEEKGILEIEKERERAWKLEKGKDRDWDRGERRCVKDEEEEQGMIIWLSFFTTPFWREECQITKFRNPNPPPAEKQNRKEEEEDNHWAPLFLALHEPSSIGLQSEKLPWMALSSWKWPYFKGALILKRCSFFFWRTSIPLFVDS